MSDERDLELPEPEKAFEPDPNFPHVVLTGGPHGKNIDMKVDGKKVPKVYKVELEASVHDVVRLTTYQFVNVSIELETRGVEDGGYIASVEFREYRELGEIVVLDHEKTKIIEGRGKTRREALLAAIEQFPEDA